MRRIEEANKLSIEKMLEMAEAEGFEDTIPAGEASANAFGHELALSALGHGAGWSVDYNNPHFEIPLTEFYIF